MLPSFTQSDTFRASSQLNVELSRAVQILIVLFSSGDLSGSGDQCAALCLSMFHLQCCLNSTLLTCALSLFSSIYHLPSSSSLSPSFSVYETMNRTDIRLRVIQSCSTTFCNRLFHRSRHVSYLWPSLTPLCLGKLVLPLLVIFSPLSFV